ncbi:MAG: hypothetical protein DLM55_04860 [Acidimicrobiales bacterium]|nr:MAG: hypothetical protein DLM55_04860 [Acidimicrobiales bacterium]
MALYSELTEPQRQQVCALFGIDYQQSSHIEGGAANTSYIVTNLDNERFVLTLLDNAINRPPQMLARLLRHLDAHGIATSGPVESIRGKLIERFDDHQVMVKRFVEGSCHDILPIEHLAAAGAALARVHALPALDWLPRGPRRLTNASEHLGSFADVNFASWVRDGLDEAQGLLELDEPLCVIHGDYFADNLITTPRGGIAILDWETASTDIAVLDIGFAVVGLTRLAGELDNDRLRSFLQGYQSVRELNDREIAHVQTATIYGATVLGYYRYLRHHIRYPNPRKYGVHREMRDFVGSVRERWSA